MDLVVLIVVLKVNKQVEGKNGDQKSKRSRETREQLKSDETRGVTCRCTSGHFIPNYRDYLLVR